MATILAVRSHPGDQIRYAQSSDEPLTLRN
jgi:hypothetical protein